MSTVRLTGLVVLAVLAAACSGAPPASPVAAPTGTPAGMLTPSPASMPTATPSPSPTFSPTATPTATGSPTASPTDGAGADVVDRFLDSFAQEQPPFHVESDVRAHIESGGDSIDLTIVSSGDVSGEDFAGEVSTDSPGRQVTVGVVIVDGAAYTRIPGGEWTETPDYTETQPLNPFALLQSDDLEYVGRAERGGRELHHLRTETWIGGRVDDVVPNAELELGDSVFDIYVSDDGLPVEAQLEFSIAGTSAGDAIELTYLVDYRFSNIGQPVTIEAPID